MSHQQSSTFPLLAHHWFCRSIANQEEVDFTDRGNQNTMSIPRQSKKVSANLVPILDQSLTQASIRPKSTNAEPISITNISSFDISPDIMPIHHQSIGRRTSCIQCQSFINPCQSSTHLNQAARPIVVKFLPVISSAIAP